MGVWGEVKGWWVERRVWVGSVAEAGVKSGKWVIHRGEKPVGAGRREDFTAALWSASRRFPSGVELQLRSVGARAWRIRTSPG